MNFLVTGSQGQLGRELQRLAPRFPQHSFVFTDVSELDITCEADVQAFFSEQTFDVLLNCAAYTAVDKAETEREAAFKINVVGVRNLAQAAAQHNCLLIHISTDYVFDGAHSKPYTESDLTHPMGYYGLTKLEGEKAVLEQGPCAVILRTSWLYSSFGSNFVKTITQNARERGVLKVVFDQIGCPTYAGDLAEVILHIAQNYNRNACEIYHYTNEGVASWYDFAFEIVSLQNIPCTLTPVTTGEYPTPAERPHYSVFDKSKIKTDFGIRIPHWRESLKKCLSGE